VCKHGSNHRAYGSRTNRLNLCVHCSFCQINSRTLTYILILYFVAGKTCGFLLPAFHQHLLKNPKPIQGRVAPVLLVLAPTRELSVQIMEEAQRFGRPLGIRSLCCYGGSSKFPQIAALERGVECIIATPGRLNDLIEMKKADLSNIQYLVLDEADRMLGTFHFFAVVVCLQLQTMFPLDSFDRTMPLLFANYIMLCCC
jgi:hypothetical protein